MRKEYRRVVCFGKFPNTTTLAICVALLLVALKSGIAREPRSRLNVFDVVVYDATAGGVAAAIAAGRRNKTVALLCASWPSCFLEGGRTIGGMSANGLGQSDIASNPDEVIGGIAAEFYRRNRKHYNSVSWKGDASNNCRLPSPHCNVTYNLEPHVSETIFREMLEEEHVPIFFDAQVESVYKEGTSLRSLFTRDGREFAADVFIDASYEGDLLPRANVSFVVGRESRAQYNESLAGISRGARLNQFDVAVDPFDESSGQPLRFATVPSPNEREGDGDRRVQSYNFRLCVTTKDTNNSVPFPKPNAYNMSDWELLRRYLTACVEQEQQCQLGFPSCNTAAVPNSKYDMNNCGGFSSDFIGGSWSYSTADYEEREHIYRAHMAYQQGLLWTMANDPDVPESVRSEMSRWGLCGDEFRENSLAPFWPPGLYVRGARRLLGDRVFTQNTPSDNESVVESIGLGAYNFDSHNAQRWACRNESACLGLGPAGTSGNRSFVWNEGDVQVNPGTYAIPRWVSLPRPDEASNLLVVGALSASHIGLSTLRMEPQFMIIGHSAGTTASLAIDAAGGGTDLNVSSVPYTALRRELVREGQRLDIPGQST